MLNLMRSLGVACFAVLLSISVASAVDLEVLNDNGSKSRVTGTGANGAVDTSLKTCISGESACVSTSPDSYTMTRGVFLPSAQVAVDTQIKASPGYVSHMNCYGIDAAAVAGTIILYDNTAESGTVLQRWDVSALDHHSPITFPIMAAAATGIYLGFTTTTDVNCTVFYR